MVQSFILLIILIILNAIFASAEIAVISMNETRLKKLASDGDKRAKKLLSLTEQPAHFLATIQVAITLAGLLQSAFAAENFAGPLVTLLVNAGVTISPTILKSISIILITLVLAYFNLVFGELVPKRVAMKKSESLSLRLANLLFLVSRVFAPLVWLLTVSTNGVLRLMGLNPNEEDDSVSEEEIRMLLAEGNEKGVIQTDENEIIQNVFELDDISVEEICTHRRDVISLSTSDNLETWEKTIKNSRHTHYPVYKNNQDDIIGILDTKDYFRLQSESKKELIEQSIEHAFFIPKSIKANVLLRKMKQTRNYFAVIIDEYGGMTGIITLHDLVEALIGDLDEKDEEERPAAIEKITDTKWKIQGYAYLDDVAKEIKYSFPVDEYDTFNGFICDALGRVPKEGESFTWEDGQLRVQVFDVQDHIIQESLVELILDRTDLDNNTSEEK